MEGSKLPKPSGLRPPQIKTAKPLNELALMLSNVHALSSSSSLKFKKHHLSRRSKSATDLRMVASNPANKEQDTKTQTSKMAQKRKADKPNKEIKPDNVKKAKISDWDYKGRYNQLCEKHTLLIEQCKKHSSKIEELEDLEKNYNAIRDQHNKLKEEHTKLLPINREQNNENIQLKAQVEDLCNQIDDLLKKDKLKSQEIENLSKEIKYLTSIREKFNQLQVKHEKQENDYKTLIITHEKTLNEYESFSRNLNKEIKTNEELSDKITHLIQDINDGEVERRRLHNLVQDLKGNIRVFCRVRPPINSEESGRLQCRINYIDEKSLEIRKSRGSVSPTGGRPTYLKAEFSFDKVFAPESSQVEIFEDLSQLVQSALDGYDICVFAYGQTGSGKTYTMHGGESLNEAGLIPRTVDLIFNSISRAGWIYEVKASFLEIYNETVRDLLSSNAQNLEIRFNEGKGTTVTNLTIQLVKSADELKNWMQIAQRNRAVAATDVNEHSSRSHSVTKIYLHGVNDEAKVSYTGSINLVDLAGSESAKTSENERLIETKNINKSLSCLGSVMLALYNKETHIPYRNSKLTYLLQSSLGGNSKTLMVVNIAPFEECYAESINSLRFAAKVKEVKTSRKRNKTTLNISPARYF